MKCSSGMQTGNCEVLSPDEATPAKNNEQSRFPVISVHGTFPTNSSSQDVQHLQKFLWQALYINEFLLCIRQIQNLLRLSKRMLGLYLQTGHDSFLPLHFHKKNSPANKTESLNSYDSVATETYLESNDFVKTASPMAHTARTILDMLLSDTLVAKQPNSHPIHR